MRGCVHSTYVTYAAAAAAAGWFVEIVESLSEHLNELVVRHVIVRGGWLMSVLRESG